MNQYFDDKLSLFLPIGFGSLMKKPALLFLKFSELFKVSSSYHLCVECFSQLSFDSEVYTKSAAVANFVCTSESNESCEKHSTQR